MPDFQSVTRIQNAFRAAASLSARAAAARARITRLWNANGDRMMS